MARERGLPSPLTTTHASVLQQNHKVCRGRGGGEVREAARTAAVSAWPPGWGAGRGLGRAARKLWPHPRWGRSVLTVGLRLGSVRGLVRKLLRCTPMRAGQEGHRIAKNPVETRPQAPQRAPASAKRTHKCKSLAWACGGEWGEGSGEGWRCALGRHGGRLQRGSAIPPSAGLLGPPLHVAIVAGFERNSPHPPDEIRTHKENTKLKVEQSTFCGGWWKIRVSGDLGIK